MSFFIVKIFESILLILLSLTFLLLIKLIAPLIVNPLSYNNFLINCKFLISRDE